MSISAINSVQAGMINSSLNPLQASNKQPELALQLIMQSLAGLDAPMQSAPQPVAAVAPPGTGQYINVVA